MGNLSLNVQPGEPIVDQAGRAVHAFAAKWQALLRSIASPVSGGAAWSLVGTGQTATGVYDHAVDGSKANIDFVGLSNCSELRVVARGLTDATTGVRCLRVSVDNGVTFFSSSGDYISIDNTGVEANQTFLAAHSTNSTSARSFATHIVNTRGVEKLASVNTTTGPQLLFIGSASDINAIRISNSGGGNITAGTVRVYGR